MKTLGEFKYHRFDISLKVTDDETKFTVESTEYSTTDRKSGVNRKLEYFNLSEARRQFETLLNQALYYTSLSDVSLWMQHNG
jgi:predicted GNAT family acetyltransferase